MPEAVDIECRVVCVSPLRDEAKLGESFIDIFIQEGFKVFHASLLVAEHERSAGAFHIVFAFISRVIFAGRHFGKVGVRF